MPDPTNIFAATPSTPATPLLPLLFSLKAPARLGAKYPHTIPCLPSTSRLLSTTPPEEDPQPPPPRPSTQHEPPPFNRNISWVDLYLPTNWQPYARLARLHNSTGTWLLAWPSFWSIAMATEQGCPPDANLLLLFSAGAVLLRGAGCTINDYLDRDLDRQVERTKSRPIASGAVSPENALKFLIAQLSLGFLVLMQLNWYAVAVGASSLLLVGTYPLAKRVTSLPQAYLGLTINWGVLLGWAAVRGSLDWSVVLPLYMACVNWTLIYDTVYAHQDKKDDALAGVKSSALTFGQHTRNILMLAALAQYGLMDMAAINAGAQSGLYVASIFGMQAYQIYKLARVNLDKPEQCQEMFESNRWLASLPFLAIVLTRMRID